MEPREEGASRGRGSRECQGCRELRRHQDWMRLLPPSRGYKTLWEQNTHLSLLRSK